VELPDGTSFAVGSDGNNNQLLVTDGGQVIGNSASYIGGNGGNGRNSATISGTGSVWNTGAGALNLGWPVARTSFLSPMAATSSSAGLPCPRSGQALRTAWL